jgi:medium-chain acyl-[acyl-carrier-protein] hydrolase
MFKIKLFCFPYAGGSAVIFNKWKQYLDSAIELVPVELAGRGRRIHEALYKDVSQTIDDVYQIVTKNINGSRYALFGHSMGAMISYQLCQKLREKNYPAPLHVFFSGRNAPHIKRPDEKRYHLLEEEAFKEEVITLGGTPTEFFDHPELLEVFIPLLKNDFKLAETDIHNGEIHPLDCHITVFLGKEEDLTTEQCDGWKKHTKKLCTVHYFEGGHFFINDETEQIVRLINNTLLNNIYG